MAQEIELKLEIDRDNLPLLLEDPLFARLKTHSANQVTVYYDTPETALKDHGFTLRVRNIDGRFVQTVKPVTDSVGLVFREEIEFDVKEMAPDLAPLAEHPISAVLQESSRDKLTALIRCDVTRTTAVHDRGHSRIRLDLDHGSVSSGERSEEFAELEFELIEGAPATLLIAARRLADHLPVRLGVLTKAERGFRLASGTYGKVSKSSSVHVHRGMTLAEAFEVIVHACLKHYRLNEPLVIRKCKPEALHQARVAMRRLRSAFSLFKPAIQDIEFHHLRHELRWFTSQLGDARNLDVYLQREMEEGERTRLLRERDRAYERVADAMNSNRFRCLLIDIVGWVAIGAWRRAKPASRSVMTFANIRLDKLWQSITLGGHAIAQMDAETRHKLRIQAKKIRYATEFMHGLYHHSHGPRKRFADAVEKLQEALGHLNDLANARGLSGGPPNDDWLIGSYEERRHLKDAEDAFRELLDAGAYWRAPIDVEGAADHR